MKKIVIVSENTNTLIRCILRLLQMSEEALMKRHTQGWLQEYTNNLDVLIKRIRETRAKKEVS